MTTDFKIEQWVSIQNRKLTVNGEEIFVSDEVTVTRFLKSVYRFLQMDYPKFHKMDTLSKLAILGSEVVLKKQENQDIALVFANAAASLDTDIKHQESIQDREHFFPSPAVFVYTLPNICIGEVSIRHQLKSESIFFVQQSYDAEQIKGYTDYLLKNEKAEKVWCGWVNALQEEYKAVFYLVSKTGSKAHHTTEIDKIIKQ